MWRHAGTVSGGGGVPSGAGGEGRCARALKGASGLPFHDLCGGPAGHGPAWGPHQKVWVPNCVNAGSRVTSGTRSISLCAASMRSVRAPAGAPQTFNPPHPWPLSMDGLLLRVGLSRRLHGWRGPGRVITAANHRSLEPADRA